MAKKRDRLEIIHDILRVIQDTKAVVRPTHIMYKSNLSHPMLTEYIDELKTKGFLVESTDKNGKKSYELTEKGHSYLRDYGIIRGFVDSYGLD